MGNGEFELGRWQGAIEHRLRAVERDLGVIKRFFYGFSVGLLMMIAMQVLSLIGLSK